MNATDRYKPNGWDVVTGAVLVLVFCAVAIAATQLHVVSDPGYPDFIVGALAWGSLTKSQDLATLPALALAMVGTLWIFGLATRQLHANATHEASRDMLAQHVFLWAIPAVIAVSGGILGDRVDPFLLAVSFAGLLALLVSIANNPPNAAAQLAERSLALFGLALISLMPLELTLVMGRVADISERAEAMAVVLSRWAFPLVMVMGVIAIAKREASIRSALPWILLIGQAGLLCFYFALGPVPAIAPNGPLPYNPSIALKLALLAIVAYGAYDLLARFRRSAASAECAPWELLSPIAMFGLLVALRYGNANPPILSPDDYHFGEALLGWWSLLDLGRLPYRDYFPPRGMLADDLRGLIGRLFFDGTAASLAEARSVTFALASLAAFLFLQWRTKSLALAFVSILMLGVFSDNVAWLLLVPFCCVMHPEQWTWSRAAIWVLCSMVLVVAIAAQGMVLAAATLPGMLLFLWAQREPLRRSWPAVLSVAALFALVAALTPLGQMWMGSVRYVLENGTINQVAWGIPWHASWPGESRKSGVVFEVLRMSWMAAPLLGVGLAAYYFRDRSRWPWLMCVAVPVALFFVFLSPYAMGRIDANTPSRAGILSNFAWTAMIPILLLPIVGTNAKARALLILGIAGICSAIGLVAVSRTTVEGAVSSRLRLHAQPVDAASAGMPSIGLAFIDPSHWSRLQRLKATLDELIPAGETYLDLTNRSAHYFYMARPPAMTVPAPMNMVPIAQQRRELESLRVNPPRVALIEAENITHDGGGLALRTPLLYRFVMDTYEPEVRNGLIIGRLKRGHAAAKDAASQPREARWAIKDFSDVNWQRGVSRSEAAIIVEDPAFAAQLSAGDSVRLPDGQSRVVRRIWPEGSALWLEGGLLGAEAFTQGRFVTIDVTEASAKEHALALWDRAFRVADLHKIPSAWGKAWHSLERRVDRERILKETSRTLGDLVARGEEAGVVGPNPRMSFEVAPHKVSGRDVGLLGFDFKCIGKAAQPRLQVFWWGDGPGGPREVASLMFAADDGKLVVPLDAFPRWLTLRQVQGIRIDLHNATACSAISVRNPWLAQRSALSPAR